VERVLDRDAGVVELADEPRHQGDVVGALARLLLEIVLRPLGRRRGRRDLRDRLAFTIDPGTAKDHDDALTVETDGDGWRVLVHIADVAASVRPGSALDGEARRRAFSVYLPGRVEPMLPFALSSGLCSLVPDRPRDTVTVELVFAADGTLVGRPSFSRAQIVSARRLAYDGVERALAGSEPVADAVLGALRSLDGLATVLRERRRARGALMLNQGELELDLGDGRVRGARRIGEPRAHALVEELMIASNEAVAAHCQQAKAPCLYRAHEPPEADAVEALYAKLEALDVPTPPLPEHLPPREAGRAAVRAAEAVQRHARAQGVSGAAWTTLVLRALQQARYDPSYAGHMGLASAAYCHFTSPIRRYPDLVVHRALLSTLGGEPAPESGGALQELAAHCSAAERAAERLERRGDALAIARYLADQIRDDPREAFAGEVTGLVGSGAFVRFGGLYEGFLPARTLALDYYELGPLEVSLVGRTSGHAIRLGDRTDVVVERIDAPRGRVTLDPATGGRS
jgi:ribonuclease R